MKLSFTTVRTIAVKTLITVFCCIIIGLARYGVSIFNPYNHLFIFVMFALYFSMFFFIMRDMDLK
ncbi:MAG: hypothetical protein PHP42_05280, partial [Bacteroidota bacterium]|nr:hypothetical protein [Bacteroidota bacterium]